MINSVIANFSPGNKSFALLLTCLFKTTDLNQLFPAITMPSVVLSILLFNHCALTISKRLHGQGIGMMVFVLN